MRGKNLKLILNSSWNLLFNKTRIYRTILMGMLMLFIPGCDGDNDSPQLDIYTRLSTLPGVSVKILPTSDHFIQIFELRIQQPLDHNSLDGPKFSQKIYIGHVDENLPVILETEGYSRSSFRTRELAPKYEINQISIEHRFYGESVPASLEWQYLNIQQAAADVHAVVELLKDIYPNSWISSGRSKGGSTAIYHRRFYPNDVTGTISFVAPILFAKNDLRFSDYFKTVGTPECREKVQEFQRAILNQRDEIAPLLVNWTNDINTIYGTDFKYSYPLDMIIKHATIEYGFSFWRSIDLGCDDIPDANTSAETLFNHMVEIVDFIQDFTDYGVNFWKPYYFQTTTEIGEIDYPTEHIDDLLQPLDPFFEFETTNTFSPEIMMDIANWVKSESTNIIFIYGQDDPWTIAAYEVTGNSNVFKFIAPQTKHEASIENLESVDKVKVHEVIQGWLGN